MTFFKKPKKTEDAPTNWEHWVPSIVEGSESEHYLIIHDPGMTIGNAIMISERCWALGLRQMNGCMGKIVCEKLPHYKSIAR